MSKKSYESCAAKNCSVRIPKGIVFCRVHYNQVVKMVNECVNTIPPEPEEYGVLANKGIELSFCAIHKYVTERLTGKIDIHATEKFKQIIETSRIGLTEPTELVYYQISDDGCSSTREKIILEPKIDNNYLDIMMDIYYTMSIHNNNDLELYRTYVIAIAIKIMTEVPNLYEMLAPKNNCVDVDLSNGSSMSMDRRVIEILPPGSQICMPIVNPNLLSPNVNSIRNAFNPMELNLAIMAIKMVALRKNIDYHKYLKDYFARVLSSAKDEVVELPILGKQPVMNYKIATLEYFREVGFVDSDNIRTILRFTKHITARKAPKVAYKKSINTEDALSSNITSVTYGEKDLEFHTVLGHLASIVKDELNQALFNTDMLLLSNYEPEYAGDRTNEKMLEGYQSYVSVIVMGFTDIYREYTYSESMDRLSRLTIIV